jgi:SnoaL-like domain
VSADDKLAVAETVYRYAIGIDTRDFALYRSIFAPEVAIDFTSYSGGEAAVMTADQWVGAVRPLFTGLAATQHSMTNPLPVVDGDRATCRMYMQAHHVYQPDEPSSWFTIGGYYDDALIRSVEGPAGWLLTGVTLTVLWRQGDPAIMVTARAAGQTILDSA